MLKLNLPNSFHSPRKRRPSKRDFIFENIERVRLMTLNHYRINSKGPCDWRGKCNTKLEDLVFKLTSSNTRLPVNRAEIVKDPKYRFPEQKRRKKRKKSISSNPNSRKSIDRNITSKSSTDFLRKFMSNVNKNNEERIMKELKMREEVEATYGAVNSPRKHKHSKSKETKNTKPATILKTATYKVQAPVVDDIYNFKPTPVVVTSSSKEIGCQWNEFDKNKDLKVCYPSKYSNFNIAANNAKNISPEPEKRETNEVATRKSYNDIFKRKSERVSQNTQEEKKGRSRSKSTNANKQQIIVSSRYNKSKNKLTRTFNNMTYHDTKPPPAEPFPAIKRKDASSKTPPIDGPKPKKTDGTSVKEKKKKHKPPAGYLLPDKERLETLKLLQKEYYKVWRELRRIPTKTNVVEMKIKKIRLEEDLKELEKNIKAFSCSRVIIRPG